MLQWRSIYLLTEFLFFFSTKHTLNQVNLDPQLRADILQMLSTPHKTTFDEAQRRIQSLLESDSYLRFLTSDIYTQLLNSEQERKKDEAEEAAEAAAAASMAESELLESDDARTPTPSTSRLGGRTRQPTSSSSNLASSPFLEDDCWGRGLLWFACFPALLFI